MKNILLSVVTLLLFFQSSQSQANTIQLTPDKSELIHLDQDAASIIVGNPAHLSVLAESSRLLVLIPKEPGATHFTVLDSDGNVILENHAIIAAPKENYVRIRRSCTGSNSKDCQQTSVFYCPDMCHSIKISSAEQAAAPQDKAEAEKKGAEDYTPPAPEQEPTSD